MRKDGRGHGDHDGERSPRAATAFAIIVPIALAWLVAGAPGWRWLRAAIGF